MLIVRRVTLTSCLFLLAFGGATLGATCPIRFRVWEGGGDVWFDHGEVVRVSASEPRPRLGVYVRVGRNNVVAAANWGYPRDFGFKSVRAAEVADHLRFVRQNDRDIEAGRLRFTSVAAGETSLGYRIVGVTEPGSLTELPEKCLVGEVRIEIVEDEAEDLLGDEQTIEACQEALIEKYAAAGNVDLDFKTAAVELSEDPFLSDESDGHEATVVVEADILAAGRRSPVAYDCRVDRSSGEVLELKYRAP